jgi:hypothetical protein
MGVPHEQFWEEVEKEARNEKRSDKRGKNGHTKRGTRPAS